MPRPFAAAALIGLTFAAASVAAAPATTGPATRPANAKQTDPKQKAAVAKYWSDQLTAANRELTLRGPASKTLDRVGLWLQKSEALLQTGQMGPAAQAFEHAAAEPGVAADVADHAKAMAALVRKSDLRGFHPAATKQTPYPPTYDIADPANRPAALAALYGIEYDALWFRIDKAKAATEQGAVTGQVKAVAALRPLDRVVNQNAEETDDLEQKVAAHFEAAVGTWTAKTADRMATIKADAQQPVQTSESGGARMLHSNLPARWRLRGVLASEQAEAKEAASECERLAGAYQTVEPLLSPAALATLKPVKDHVQNAYDKSKDVLSQATRPTGDNITPPPN